MEDGNVDRDLNAMLLGDQEAGLLSPGTEVREPGVNSVPLPSFMERVEAESNKLTGNYQNYLDCFRKHEQVPKVSLGPMPRSWAMVFELADQGDEDSGEKPEKGKKGGK